MKNHLKPNGLIVFESRNPKIDWSTRWDYDMKLWLPNDEVRESRRFIKMENDLMTFEFRFDFPDETILTESTIRFWSYQEIETMLTQAGLVIENAYGDWSHGSLSAATSEEMIFLVRHESNFLRPLTD
jgi:hypothetical protein